MENETALNVYAVLLAGGTGTRLWPVSRELYPKQLVKLIDQYSLLQATIKRLFPLIDPDCVRVVCGAEHVDETARHMREIGVDPKGKILSEPCGRNTAPAILLSVLHILSNEPNAIICVFPADHMIGDVPEFHIKVTSAIQLALKGYIVTFGIEPDYAETGYGYIEGSESLPNHAKVVKRFVEKPNKDLAQQYLDAGNYYWNSGMFTFQASVMVSEFEQHCPDIINKMKQLDLDDTEAVQVVYENLPDISIDYAIMEHTGKGAILPSAFGWSDIGTWKSLYDFLPKDHNGNVLEGDVIIQDTRDCFVMGHNRLVVTNRIRDMVVIETPDAIFISDMDNSRNVKSLVSRIKSAGRWEYQKHRTVYHAWGTQTRLEEYGDHDISKLVLYPNSDLQLDTNKGQEKHLSVTRGNGWMVSGDHNGVLEKSYSGLIKENQQVTIRNPGPESLHIVCITIETEETTLEGNH